MPVNSNLATLSDAAFASAFAIYFLAFVLSVVYYVKAKSTVELQRAHDEGDEVSLEQLKKSAAKSRKFVNMTQMMVTLGVMVQAVSIIMRGASVRRFPFGNLYEYVTVITFVAVLIALVSLRRKELRPMWPWVLLPVLAMLYAGGKHLYTDSAPVIPALQSVWLPIHVSTVSVGASIGLISGLASLLYLLRMYQPVGKEKGFLGSIAAPLPEAKVLDRIAYKTAAVCVPVFGLGVILGAIWAESAWGRAWGWDPKETISFVTWILYAAYLHARATRGWQSKGAAWINIVAFGTMIFNLFFINLVVSGLHSYAGLN